MADKKDFALCMVAGSGNARRGLLPVDSLSKGFFLSKVKDVLSQKKEVTGRQVAGGRDD